MKGSKAAGRYAQSLLGLAVERGVLEEVKVDMAMVASLCAESHELELLLQSPIIKTDKKVKVLTIVFERALHELSLSFIQLVTRKGRERYLPLIASSFIQLYKDRKGIVTAEVTTAQELSSDQRKEVLTALKNIGKGVELVEHVDGSIIGGMKVRVGDQRYDATIRKKLSELKHDILK